jgi:ppGpp synthetase/RelA/SpoT-type nucleotidyltranferase
MEYKGGRNIYADTVDFSGMRIALYFPDDRIKVQKIIRKVFIVSEKNFSYARETKKSRCFEQRFDGYRADHYRVFPRGLKKKQEHSSKALIEIHVASLFVHAWSEVGHGLGYMPVH